MATHPAVGIDDDFSTGQSAVPLRTPDHEATGRVDVQLGVFVDKLLRKGLVDDQIHDGLAELLVLDLFVVLGADDDRVDANGNVVFVFEGNLSFTVRAQKVDDLLLPDCGQLAREHVRILDRRRHELGALVGGISEHQALISRTLLLVQTVPFVDSLGDIRTLPLDGRQNRTRIRIKARCRPEVPDVAHSAQRTIFG